MMLPEGVRLTPLVPHADDRGVFTELHRLEWDTGVEPVQWNAVRSRPGVLRGVHVHARHDDYLVLLSGRATIGLADLREGSPSFGAAVCVEMDGDAPAGLSIPWGVAHGFLFHEPSLHVYAVTHYWDVTDELGCRWDDPDLAIPWPACEPQLSPRDAALPSQRELMASLAGQLAA